MLRAFSASRVGAFTASSARANSYRFASGSARASSQRTCARTLSVTANRSGPDETRNGPGGGPSATSRSAHPHASGRAGRRPNRTRARAALGVPPSSDRSRVMSGSFKRAVVCVTCGARLRRGLDHACTPGTDGALIDEAALVGEIRLIAASNRRYVAALKSRGVQGTHPTRRRAKGPARL